MRKVRITILAACFLSGLLGFEQHVFAGQLAGEAPPTAQQVRLHRGQAERELQRMSATLNLTEEQKARILPILQRRNQQLKNLRANSLLPQGEARKQATAIRKSARRQIDLILTPEQKEERKARLQGKRIANRK
jgi:Spy/CpxP family protein refolding chaperone